MKKERTKQNYIEDGGSTSVDVVAFATLAAAVTLTFDLQNLIT